MRKLQNKTKNKGDKKEKKYEKPDLNQTTSLITLNVKGLNIPKKGTTNTRIDNRGEKAGLNSETYLK